ncbi:MAG: lipoprotein [Gammaproteobacteria bacterium]|nr:lipoprotein [Gammaproteobacteria bacterium]
MPKLSCLLLVALLAACGMKGNLYEPQPPATSEPETDDADRGDRKSTPNAPDPALAQ